MYAYRSTWILKPGCMDKALELNQEWAQKGLFSDDGQFRFYTPSISPNLFVFEVVIESDEAREKGLTQFRARPESREYWERMWDLAERYVGTERWTVTDIQ